ncbi:anti-sigma factor family protein [Azospirillum halopraeferens]|uniref:anti-sigma factor family protein n=1 Tax=Azospirillum halopraeferens TaxID=34010 RepID=UPI000428E850|nr:hypothetical protein [Azospirillum halopraeferens]
MSRIPSEEDLQAYVDGLIDPERLHEVEGWLADNPAEAARLRDYHRLNRQIRAGLEQLAAAPPPATAALEQRLFRNLAWRIALRRVGTAMAASLLLAGGWGLRDWMVPPEADMAADGLPLYANEAAEAHRTATLLAHMEGGTVWTVADDPDAPVRMAEFLTTHAGSDLALPAPSDDLRYLGATLVPWDEGTALQVLYREADGELLTLFVATALEEATTEPREFEQDGLRLVYWQSGRTSYTVGGADTDDDLPRVARQMAESTG